MWVNTYFHTIFSGMNIHKYQLFWCELQGYYWFWPIPKWTTCIPRCSMYGIFTNIYPINDPNVGKYTIHGSYGIWTYINLWSAGFLGTIFSSKPYAIICHLVCAMWMPWVVAAVITKPLPGGEAYFWCPILMNVWGKGCWVLFFLQLTQDDGDHLQISASTAALGSVSVSSVHVFCHRRSGFFCLERRSSGNLYSASTWTPQFGSLKSHCTYSTWCVKTSIFGG